MQYEKELQLYKNQLHHSFSGTPWFGPSLLTQLENISPELAVKRLTPERKNIAEYIMHIITWRKFVIEKLQGNDTYSIEINSLADWPKVEKLDGVLWNEILSNLQQTQELLLNLLEKFTTSRLDELVPGTPFKFKIMLAGLAQHDIYHSGQIGLYKSLLKG